MMSHVYKELGPDSCMHTYTLSNVCSELGPEFGMHTWTMSNMCSESDYLLLQCCVMRNLENGMSDSR